MLSTVFSANSVTVNFTTTVTTSVWFDQTEEDESIYHERDRFPGWPRMPTLRMRPTAPVLPIRTATRIMRIQERASS